MSLLTDLNRIVSDRRLANDLQGSEPVIPPFPTGVSVSSPARSKGSSAGFVMVGLYPTPPTLVQTPNSQFRLLSQTTASFPRGVNTGPAQTTVGGPEVGGGGGSGDLSYPNPNYVVS